MRITVYLPDGLAAQVRASRMNVSAVCQQALRRATGGDERRQQAVREFFEQNAIGVSGLSTAELAWLAIRTFAVAATDDAEAGSWARAIAVVADEVDERAALAVTW